MDDNKDINLKDMLEKFCSNMDFNVTDVPELGLTRVKLPTRTVTAIVSLQFDNDHRGFQHFTILAKLRPKDIERYVEIATRNPPREITPVHNENGMVGIQGAKSYLYPSQVNIEEVFLDVFGRIVKYVDSDFREIMRELQGEK